MKFIDGLLLTLVFLMWLTVTIHVTDLQNVHSSAKGQILRTDFILVPICISVTIYIFWNIFKQNRK